MIIHGDCMEELTKLETDTVDLVCTDPPYGYSFMGKDWDKAVPCVEIWQECLRVLKPGAFCFVMSAPRSDVQNAMISRLMQAGFRLDFTPIYWTYASGFPKAGNIGKMVDKRLGAEREIAEVQGQVASTMGSNTMDGGKANTDYVYTNATSDQAKALDGSYAGFQPKPAVEVIIVAMKPLSEKTFVDQALKNGKGITWLDDCRVPTQPETPGTTPPTKMNGYGGSMVRAEYDATKGRFPANLIVSDDVLNDGTKSKSSAITRKRTTPYAGGDGKTMGGGWNGEIIEQGFGDSGSYSRYFDLDKWASTLPFLITPKASKSEKNRGLEHLEDRDFLENKSKQLANICPKHQTRNCECGYIPASRKNHHPTVKPLKLMSYLITLGSRPNDTVLDPFVGSGTTVVAAKQLGRNGVGIERETEYAEIARARVAHLMPQLPPEQPPLTQEVKDKIDKVIHNYHEQMRFI